LALSTLLVLIYISNRFIAYLVQASVGDLPVAFIFQLLALKLLSGLILILPLSFFLAILLSLGRLYKDNEITAMAACGIPMPTGSIISFGAMFAIVVGLLTLLVAPWAERQLVVLQNDLSTIAAEVSGVAAGRFKGFSQGQGIFYVESIESENNTMQKLFMQTKLPDKQIIMTATSGYKKVQEGELFMILIDGYRYENNLGSLNYVVTKFAEHKIRIPKLLGVVKSEESEAIPTEKLWFAKEPALQAELQWRFSLPLSVILLAALAIPLSHTNPRQGQYSKIFAGIVIYLIYGNLLNIAKKWLERGDIPTWIGIWWVHLGLLVIILFLFYLPFLKIQIRKFSINRQRQKEILNQVQ
jgi:lipopolysaccharide export system permease protein